MKVLGFISPLYLWLLYPDLVEGLAGRDVPGGGDARSTHPTDRRALLTGLVTSAAAAATWAWVAPKPAAYAVEPSSSLSMAEAPSTGLENVYFGVGCFWHIQHEFVQAERERLGRKDSELTSMAGYAGGSSVGDGGKVCYHNFQRVADYGALGHGEVVGMSIPSEEIVPFTSFYFSLFNQRTKDRVDPMDRGGEYRSLLGLPGGTQHSAFPEMQMVAEKAGFKLVPGKGNDPDTLGKQIVFVYDTKKFPFHQAEVYHQFHNDFQSPPYGKAYNDIANQAFEDGRIKTTGCPDRV